MPLPFNPIIEFPYVVEQDVDGQQQALQDSMWSIFQQYTTGVNQALQSVPTVQAFVAVPATHASAGTPGQWSADSSFLYVCYTTNAWARLAWTSTTF